MLRTLHIYADRVRSIDDIYTIIESYITHTTPLSSRNLDALFDVLRDLPIEKVVIHKKRHLKEVLENEQSENGEMSLYYRLLDVFTDLEDVDIELID